MEGVVDEWEEKHDGGIRFLGVFQQVAFLEIMIPLLLQVIFGEGDVLLGAVLTGLFYRLEYHRRTCLRRGVGENKKHRVFRSSFLISPGNYSDLQLLGLFVLFLEQSQVRIKGLRQQVGVCPSRSSFPK